MTLYEITSEYRSLLDAIESGEIPEEAIADTLEAVGGELADRVDNVACYIKQLRGEAAVIKSEADTLAERHKAKENKADKLAAYLFDCLKDVHKTKLETARSVVQIGKNPPSVQILDEAKFIRWAVKRKKELLSYKEPTPNKTEIKRIITAGTASNPLYKLPYCSIVQGESLRIK